MNPWPNWVDLIIVTIVLRTCYNGFYRGFFVGFLNLVGVVSATVVSLNYSRVVIQWLQPWIQLDAVVMACVVFWGIFFSLVIAVNVLIRRLTEFLKWERLHWSIQSVGLVLGLLRGLWWIAIILVAMATSGVPYLKASVEERSVLGPHVLPFAQKYLEEVANQFPGAEGRGEELIPPMKRVAKSSGE